MLMKEVCSPNFRGTEPWCGGRWTVWWSPDKYRCGGRWTSTFYFENISKTIPSLWLALGVLCVGVVVAGQVPVWWSPDKHFLFWKYFNKNPFIVNKSREGGHYYDGILTWLTRERTLLTHFLWDRTVFCWNYFNRNSQHHHSQRLQWYIRSSKNGETSKKKLKVQHKWLYCLISCGSFYKFVPYPGSAVVVVVCERKSGTEACDSPATFWNEGGIDTCDSPATFWNECWDNPWLCNIVWVWLGGADESSNWHIIRFVLFRIMNADMQSILKSLRVKLGCSRPCSWRMVHSRQIFSGDNGLKRASLIRCRRCITRPLISFIAGNSVRIVLSSPVGLLSSWNLVMLDRFRESLWRTDSLFFSKGLMPYFVISGHLPFPWPFCLQTKHERPLVFGGGRCESSLELLTWERETCFRCFFWFLELYSLPDCIRFTPMAFGMALEIAALGPEP